MVNSNLHKELKVIGKYMVSQIRREMTQRNIKASGALYKSISFEASEDTLDIKSLDYGSAILGEGAKPDGKTPPREMVSRIMKWMRYKNMSPLARGRSGRFLKQTPNAQRKAAYGIAKSIRNRGIKGSNIIQIAVNRLEKRIDKGIVEAYKSDITKEFENVITRINRTNG